MNYSMQHCNEVRQILDKIDLEKIESMVSELFRIREKKGRIFFIGVGGSAANCSHAVNDFRKLAEIESYAPSDNIAELTARTNDEGWETVFSSWLETSKISSNDGIFVLSVGGGNLEAQVSVNICRAVDKAKASGATIFGIVGREMGYTQENTDFCLVIPEVNPMTVTPHAESFQSIIWHLMVSHPTLKNSSTKW